MEEQLTVDDPFVVLIAVPLVELLDPGRIDGRFMIDVWGLFDVKSVVDGDETETPTMVVNGTDRVVVRPCLSVSTKRWYPRPFE